VHYGLHDPARDELIHLHGREISRSDRVGGYRPAFLDGLGECPGQDIGHVRGCLALDHGVGVLVDDRGGLRPRVDEEAGLVAGRLQVTAPFDQHPGQADRDVEVPGQLEHRPVGQVRVNRNQLRRHGPLLVRQPAEGRLEP
jgi:hypothetical protein